MGIDDSRWIAAKYGKVGADKIENGSAPLPPRSDASIGQVDATLRFNPAQANAADKALREAEANKRQGVQHIVQPSAEPKAIDVVEVGGLRFYPQTLRGYEAQFTRGGLDPFVFEQDGERLTTAEGLAALYNALVAQAAKGGKR